MATKVVLNDVKNTTKELRIELDAAKRKISQQRDEIDEQYHGLDDLEQYSRKNSLKIVGIPESICENESAVLKIANALNVQYSAYKPISPELRSLLKLLFALTDELLKSHIEYLFPSLS